MMRMMAITISNSIRENPRVRRPDTLMSWLSSVLGLDSSIVCLKTQREEVVASSLLQSEALLLQRREPERRKEERLQRRLR